MVNATLLNNAGTCPEFGLRILFCLSKRAVILSSSTMEFKSSSSCVPCLSSLYSEMVLNRMHVYESTDIFN